MYNESWEKENHRSSLSVSIDQTSDLDESSRAEGADIEATKKPNTSPETTAVWWSKAFVILVFIVTSTLIVIETYKYSSQREENEFETTVSGVKWSGEKKWVFLQFVFFGL